MQGVAGLPNQQITKGLPRQGRQGGKEQKCRDAVPAVRRREPRAETVYLLDHSLKWTIPCSETLWDGFFPRVDQLSDQSRKPPAAADGPTLLVGVSLVLSNSCPLSSVADAPSLSPPFVPRTPSQVVRTADPGSIGNTID